MKLTKLILGGAIMVFAAFFIFTKADTAAGDDKVLICHNGNTIEVGASAVAAHLAHGDALGGCEDCLGPTHPEVLCLAVYDPVCGCDGVTYSNDCNAYVAGVLSYTPGVCP